MSALRVLIVDDEPLARERLRSLLRPEDSIEVVGECDNGSDAIAFLRRTPPDLVFLDMQMPGCSGMQVLAELPEADRPGIIFATAHVQYAIDAFDVQAIDYLLKPFDRARLQTALRRAHEHLRDRRAAAAGTAPAGALSAEAAAPVRKNERLTVKSDGRFVFLKHDEIVWIEADDNYVVLHLVSGRLLVRETLVAIETRLGQGKFARVNRSALVHLDQVKELQPTLHGDYTVLLRNGLKLPLSRSLRSPLINIVSAESGRPS